MVTMIDPIFLRILWWLTLGILILSFFVRSKFMIGLIHILQGLLFAGIGVMAVLSLLWRSFPLPKIFILSDLRAFFLLILSVLGIGITIYTTYYLGIYLEHKKNIPFYIFLTLIFLCSIIGIIIANEMITFLILWELMSLSSYFLVVHEPSKPGVLAWGAWYFIITHIGFFAILFAFIPFLSQSGSTFFTTRSAATFSMTTQNLIFILALIGFWSKAWMFPIHVWLPKAHPIAPSHISALMSWFMVKIPILFLFIFIQQFFGNQIPLWWGVLVLGLGAVSAFIGVFYALIQHNIKRLLAYHTIENIGIICIGLWLFMLGLSSHQPALVIIGIFASLYHTFNHAIFKSLLFLSAGSVIERTGEADIEHLGGLIKYIPWVAFSFLIGSRAIIWLPPLNAFNSEILTIFGLVQWLTATQSVWMMTMFIAVLTIIWIMSAAAFYCFVKTFGVMFLGNLRDKSIKLNIKKSWSEKFAFGRLTLAILGLAAFPWLILKIVYNILGSHETSVSLFHLPLGKTVYIPGLLLVAIVVFGFLWRLIYRRVVKKSVVKEPRNCGYPVIVPRTQYSWSSFVQPLRRVYVWFFGEKRITTQHTEGHTSLGEKIYKKEMSSISYAVQHTYRLDLPFQWLTMGVDSLVSLAKKMMHGKLSIYISYIFLALIIAALLFFFL